MLTRKTKILNCGYGDIPTSTEEAHFASIENYFERQAVINIFLNYDIDPGSASDIFLNIPLKEDMINEENAFVIVRGNSTAQITHKALAKILEKKLTK